ncbi:15971_t:CDS:2 [Gigaspora rosea]|nr:15971_t:CDS:2 [Gigaspora rosea]
MSFRVHQVLDIEPLEFAVGEHVINLNDSNSYSNEQTNSLPNAFSHSNVSPWVISEKMWEIIYKFDNDILTQFPSNPNRNYPLYLLRTLSEISSVPLEKHKYLSPIFLHCSLGRTPGANPFSEYRSLVGTVNYSQNLHLLSLYSGILGAYLTPTSTHSAPSPWFEASIPI